MISVIIPTFNDERRLVAALAPLVPAAMEGLVRELICADGGSTDATFDIADDAGATFLRLEGAAAERIAKAAAKAKGPWVLILDPGVRLEFGWESAALKHMNARETPARFRLQKSEGTLLDALFPPRARALLVLKRRGRLDERAGDRSGFLGGGVDRDGLLYGRIGKVHLLDARAWV